MTIGERIKILRKQNNLTQEKIADYLCVSYQAVSKWENGVSCPDLSMIIPLAKLLNVTTDELLGAGSKDSDNYYHELEERYNETFKTGDMEMRMKITEDAVKTYPGDMDWLNRYAWDIWCYAVDHFDDEFDNNRDKAIRLFDVVITNTDNSETKVHAITGIVQCLCGKGLKAEARKYVDLFPDTKVIPSEKDRLLGKCLEGEEQLRHKQNYLDGCFNTLLQTLLWEGIAENKHTCDAAEGIIKAMIPDGNYCCYNFEMSHIKFRKAEIEAKAQNPDTALQLLKEAVHYAEEYDVLLNKSPGEYAFTAPVICGLTYNSRDWCRTGEGSLFDDIREMSKRQSFSELHDREDYKKLFCEK